MSMSDSMQTKPNQLISEPSTNSTDDMFANLGLGSYVQKKDTGAIATSFIQGGSGNEASSTLPTPSSMSTSSTSATMSLEEKRRLAQQGENMQRMQNTSQLAPMAAAQPQQKAAAKDLTASLMQKNLGQMNMGSMATSSQPMAMTGGFGVTSPTSAGWGAFQGGMSMNAVPPPMAQAAPKPDMSAFDSLLSMPSTGPKKTTMSSMMSPSVSSQPMMGLSTPQNPAVKGLSANDINDLLS